MSPLDIVRHFNINKEMRINKTTQIAVRLQPEEKRQLTYFATRLGISPSALVRNQIKSLIKELEEKVADGYYTNIAEMAVLSGPKYSQDEIENMFAAE
jgi:predicted DNA-binding protein